MNVPIEPTHRQTARVPSQIHTASTVSDVPGYATAVAIPDAVDNNDDDGSHRLDADAGSCASTGDAAIDVHDSGSCGYREQLESQCGEPVEHGGCGTGAELEWPTELADGG